MDAMRDECNIIRYVVVDLVVTVVGGIVVVGGGAGVGAGGAAPAVVGVVLFCFFWRKGIGQSGVSWGSGEEGVDILLLHVQYTPYICFIRYSS